MWMPRVSGAYTLGERTVVKGGYGLFFDTLNAGDYTGFNQLGYSVGDDQRRQHGLRPDLAARAIRGTASRRWSIRSRCASAAAGSSTPIDDSLGVDAILGIELHPRGSQSQARARAALADRRAARAAAQHWRWRSPTPAPTPTASARNINEVYVPEQYYSTVTNVRDATAADAAAAAGDESVPHQQLRFAGDDRPGALPRMAGNAFFTAATVQRQTLLRGYPQLTGLTYANLPLGVVKDHSLEITRQPPLLGRPQRQPRVRGAPGHREPDGRSLRSRADALADQPERPAVAPQRRRGLRVAVRQVQAVPERRRRGREDARWMADRRHVRVPAGRVARLGQPLLQRRSRQTSRRAIRRSPCSATARSTSTKTWFNIDAGFERDAGQAAGGVPEAQLPVPRRRRARAGDVPGEHEHRAQLRPRRPPALQFRMDVQNLFDAVRGATRTSTRPARTSEGSPTATNSIMRFFTFVGEVQLLASISVQLRSSRPGDSDTNSWLSLSSWPFGTSARAYDTALRARDLLLRDAALHGAAARAGRSCFRSSAAARRSGAPAWSSSRPCCCWDISTPTR